MPQGADQRPPPPRIVRATIHLLPECFRLHWVGSKQHFFKTKAHDMRAARSDALACDPRVRIGLANASNAFVSIHLHDKVILVRGGGIRVIIWDEQDVAVDFSDLHQVITLLLLATGSFAMQNMILIDY